VIVRQLLLSYSRGQFSYVFSPAELVDWLFDINLRSSQSSASWNKAVTEIDKWKSEICYKEKATLQPSSCSKCCAVSTRALSLGYH